MPNFTYKALTPEKRVNEGILSGHNREEVAQVLTKRNLSPLVIKELTEHGSIHGSVPTIDKIIFCRYLTTMLSSGLSLSEGIEVLRKETKHPLMRVILGDMSYSLEQGQQLSSVFERYPKVFESYFLVLTHAGEVSGKLAEVFKHLENELRSEYGLMFKIKGALMYPGIVFSAMVGIGVLMFFFVLPQIGKVFLNLKLPLPTFTRWLFQFSIILRDNMAAVLVMSLVFIIGAYFALQKRVVQDLLFYAIRPIPLVRNMIKKIDLARFTRIFSTLLKSAVPITEAMEISLNSLAWFEYRNLAKKLPDEVRKGRSLAAVMGENRVFPSLMIQMVAAGEKSGTIDSALADLAGFYEQEVEEELKNLTQILEPMLMLLVGVAVGVMILSIIAPIYSVVGSFQNAAGGPKM